VGFAAEHKQARDEMVSAGRKVTTMAASWDDEELDEALRQVFRTREDVPPEVVEAGKNVFALRDSWDADAELAQLTYDSLATSGPVRAERAGTVPARALTFSAAELTVKLECTAESVAGQLIPPHVEAITMQLSTGTETALTVDEIGSFAIRPAPPATFRLRCQATRSHRVLTPWITLTVWFS
jgi:hypothetical protein